MIEKFSIKQRFLKDYLAIASFTLVMGFLVVGVLASIIAPYDYAQQIRSAIEIPPFWQDGGSYAHVLGTDDLGRDMLSRLIYGARTSVMIGLFVTVIPSVFGVILGLLSGYYQGIVDRIIMRIVDIMMALPSILIAFVIVVGLDTGQPSKVFGFDQRLLNTVLAISVVMIPYFIRVVRASVLNECAKQYVMASKSLGVSDIYIMLRSILPNCFAPLIVQISLGFSSGILDAAALGFLGFGVTPPEAEWGTMLASGKAFMFTSWWLPTLPGLCIFIVVLSFNILGDRLRDILDPKIR
jgi:dipeptide transport system permease protein